jgi:hypothetical protein
MENQYLTVGNPNAQKPEIERAARWLSEHRDECNSSPIAALKERFSLRNAEAIAAAKLAHAIEYGRG